jgi:hypothetical protein
MPAFEVGKDWPVSHLRHEIAMTLGDDDPKEYNMVLVEADGSREKKVHVSSITPLVLDMKGAAAWYQHNCTNAFCWRH